MMMETLLSMALTNAALATLLAVPAWAVGRAFPSRPALAHALWLLVLLKLITPPMIPIGLGRAPPPAPEEATEPAARPEERPCLDLVEGPLAEPPGKEEQPPPAAGPEVVAAPHWSAWLLGTSLTGSLLFWSLAFRRIRRLARLLRELTPAGDEIQAEVAELAARLGLWRVPVALVVPAGCGLPPLVFGLRRLWLGLPADLWQALAPPQRRTILLHELAHLRRGDHWVRWLELLVLGLYWWHPVAWLAVARLRRAEEACCDAWVTWAEPAHAADYAAALVEAAAFTSRPRPRLPGVSAASPVVDLERRLVMILEAKARRRLSLAGGIILLALAAGLLPLAPTTTSAADDEPKKAPLPRDRQARIDRLVMLNSCQACHKLPWEEEKPAARAESGHDEVVRLMREVAAQRDRLKKLEDQLRQALERFEKTPAPKTPPPPAKAAPSGTSKDSDRLADVEKKLDLLLREMEAMRKEKSSPKSDSPLRK